MDRGEGRWTCVRCNKWDKDLRERCVRHKQKRPIDPECFVPRFRVRRKMKMAENYVFRGPWMQEAAKTQEGGPAVRTQGSVDLAPKCTR